MVALNYPIYILSILNSNMVEQNCVYERKMTVVYERNTPEEEDNETYAKLRERVNRELYMNRMPLVSRYHLTPSKYSEVDVDEYMPHTKVETETSYQIWNNGVMIYSSEYVHAREQAYDLICSYVLSMPELVGSTHDITHETKNEEIETTKEVWPSLENNKLIPFAFVDGDKSHLLDVTVREYTNRVSISELNGNEKVSLDITFYLNRSTVDLEFTITWAAPIKSTKANIEKHLVDIPEIVLATVMNTVETILNDSGWVIDEDRTTIDCVTQSNINTKAECSPAVISSLKKTKEELN